MRVLIILHRYLGVAVGALMVLWCLSGFVMMYQGYPRLAAADRMQALQSLAFTSKSLAAMDLPDDATLYGFRLEMAAGRPVLDVQRGPRRHEIIDLTDGAPLDSISAVDATSVAAAYAAAHGVRGALTPLGLVSVDQWTLDGINREGPLYHFTLSDPARTELYVSSVSGRVGQVTTRRTRTLAWLGAIPHWLYPTVLRQNAPLWSEVVIWSSLVGTFLTLLGLYLGAVRFRRYASGRWSPYRGWFYWHHVIGLVFGLVTLTWVASGLLTMSPFGLLESDAGRLERPALAGTFTGADLKAFLERAAEQDPAKWVALEASPFDGKLFVLATTRSGTSERLDNAGRFKTLEPFEVTAALAKLEGRKLAALERLDAPDAYFYPGFDRKPSFPVYRARLADPQSTTLYLDGRSGRLVYALDGAERQSRWFRTGLHDFDFTPGLRMRPVWDIVVLTLLAGVTAVCITGAWLGLKRTGRDLVRLRASLRRRSSSVS